MSIILKVSKPYKYVLTGTLVSSTAVAMSYTKLCSVLKLFESFFITPIGPHLDRSSLANSMLLCHHIHPTVTHKFEFFFPHLLKIKQDILHKYLKLKYISISLSFSLICSKGSRFLSVDLVVSNL